MTHHPSWRCVLLSGPAGSGKTTACRLGHRAMTQAWGHPAAAMPVCTRLGQVAEVCRVTLAPALPAVLARCAGSAARVPSRLASDAELHARKRHPGSARLDNSALSPEQTLAELARLVGTGAGRLGSRHNAARAAKETRRSEW